MRKVCAEKRVVRIAYNRNRNNFEVENDTMVQFPVRVGHSYNWEHMTSFFKAYHLTPLFIRQSKYGTLNKETGLWSGSVGMVD